MAINGVTPFLPEEIIINILKHLPVKSLMRFQCVCKHWKNLFKTPSFIQDHLHQSTHQNSSIVIGPAYYGFYLLSFNWELKFREFENAPLMGSLDHLCIFGYSNGLLCFVDWSKRPDAPLLWNPATREVRQVPIISDDFWCLTHFGFGFSPIINDYRIVRFSLDPLVYKVEVFSLSTGCWRNIEFDNIKDVCITTNDHAVTANGVMFWRGSKSIVDTNDTQVIVSFDLATEVFTVVPWPAFASYFGNLAVYDDKLAIISYPKTMSSQIYYLEGMDDDAPTYFEEMEEDRNSMYFEVMEEEAIGSSGKRWSSSKKYSGNSDLQFNAGTIWKNQIVCIDSLKCTFTEHGLENNDCLYLIDVNANEFKQFDIPRPKLDSGACVFNYVESLVPVSGNIRIDEP